MSGISDYTNQQIKALKKSFDNGTRLELEKFGTLSIFDVVNQDEFTELFTSTESLTGTKQLAERETPPLLSLGDGYAVTITNERFGGAIEVTTTQREQFRDSTTKVDVYLTRQRDALVRSLRNTFVVKAHIFLNKAFDSASEFLSPDGVELAGVHTWLSTGTTFDNSATAILDSAAVDEAEEFAGAFVDAAGIQNPLSYDTLVVKKGSAAHRQAIKLFAESIEPVAVGDINIYEGAYTIIATPYIEAANKKFWFLFDLTRYTSPLHLGILKMPSLQEPITEKNGAIWTNVEGFWDQGIINMPFNIYGSDGTT